MPYALETGKDETPASADSFSVADLLLLPLFLLAVMFDRFSRHLTRLKAMRRARPMPRDWKRFYPDLRRTEWAIWMLCFEGARHIILGQELDLSAIAFDAEPPETFQPPMPRSALSMQQRIEDTARFYADPERRIRRHAERIRRRSADSRPANPPTNFPSPNPPNFSSGPNPSNFQTIAIRGPPWLIPTAGCRLSRFQRQRERSLMQTSQIRDFTRL